MNRLQKALEQKTMQLIALDCFDEIDLYHSNNYCSYYGFLRINDKYFIEINDDRNTVTITKEGEDLFYPLSNEIEKALREFCEEYLEDNMSDDDREKRDYNNYLDYQDHLRCVFLDR